VAWHDDSPPGHTEGPSCQRSRLRRPRPSPLPWRPSRQWPRCYGSCLRSWPGKQPNRPHAADRASREVAARTGPKSAACRRPVLSVGSASLRIDLRDVA
jgi:hypothetical protein